MNLLDENIFNILNFMPNQYYFIAPVCKQLYNVFKKHNIQKTSYSSINTKDRYESLSKHIPAHIVLTTNAVQGNLDMCNYLLDKYRKNLSSLLEGKHKCKAKTYTELIETFEKAKCKWTSLNLKRKEYQLKKLIKKLEYPWNDYTCQCDCCNW